MRVRTDERRRAIMDAARSVFQEVGYDRASMSEIARRLGGSKATLYGYFPSKEELFIATVHEDIDSMTGTVIEGVRAAKDLKKALLYFGENYLRLATHPDTLGIFRMVGSQPVETGIGKVFYEQGLARARQRMAEIVREAMQRGELRKADPWLAINQLKGLLDADILEPALLNAEPDVSDARLRKAAREAVEVFLRAYAP